MLTTAMSIVNIIVVRCHVRGHQQNLAELATGMSVVKPAAKAPTYMSIVKADVKVATTLSDAAVVVVT